MCSSQGRAAFAKYTVLLAVGSTESGGGRNLISDCVLKLDAEQKLMAIIQVSVLAQEGENWTTTTFHFSRICNTSDKVTVQVKMDLETERATKNKFLRDYGKKKSVIQAFLLEIHILVKNS